MTCEKYSAEFVEAAAASAAPGASLKSHIDACPTCRVAFERERSLFADIDTSLRATANAELPASFLPSVRARLVEFEAPRSTTFSARVAFAAACAAIVVLVTVQVTRKADIEQGKNSASAKESSEEAKVSSAITSSSSNHSLTPPIATPGDAVRRTERRTIFHQTISRADALDTEVLVPPDQELVLARYAEYLRRQKNAALLLADAPASVVQPLEIELIQIAELDVLPLADNHSQ
jgi:hypothetical protein